MWVYKMGWSRAQLSTPLSKLFKPSSSPALHFNPPPTTTTTQPHTMSECTGNPNACGFCSGAPAAHDHCAKDEVRGCAADPKHCETCKGAGCLATECTG
jgi:hypothetical protein